MIREANECDECGDGYGQEILGEKTSSMQGSLCTFVTGFHSKSSVCEHSPMMSSEWEC